MIRFLYPNFLWLLALVPLIAYWRGKLGAVAAVRFSNAAIARQVARETRSRPGAWTNTLMLAALGLIVIAIARPQFGHSTSTLEASGVDMILELDCSGSMQALDFKVDGQPADRLDIVKSVVGKFIDARPNDRIGLVGFAGAPYLVSPLTLDHDWLQQNLERVNVGVGDDGTAIGSAIAAGVNRLRGTAAKSKVVILLTDGVNNTGKISPMAAAEAAHALGVKVYTIGVGVRGKAPMPVRDEAGRTHVILATVDVDEKTLQAVAQETGGQSFFPFKASDLNQDFENIANELRHQYNIFYRPEPLKTDGLYHPVTVRTRARKDLIVRARKGYYAPKL